MSKRKISRRALLAGAAGAAGVALTPEGGPDALAPGLALADEGVRASAGKPPTLLGSRSPYEQPKRLLSKDVEILSRTPLHELSGIVTPSDLHFERHHASVPQIDPREWSLLIHGMVERPTVFTLADLKRLPSRSRLHFIECSGNGREAYRKKPKPYQTAQRLDGLFSNSEWTGVPLAILFHEVGASPHATWFLAEGCDDAVMARSIPVEKAHEDALIAYGQNGEAIRPEQGYPARLLLPGWEGSANVKWLRRIELADAPFMTREETSQYTDPLKDGTARMFSFEMDAKSLILKPSYPTRLRGPGWHEISGLAWSGRGKISRVEISTNGGKQWEDAELDEPVLSKCATRFHCLWRWDGKPTVIQSRATDETGYTQPTADELRRARGVGTRYHFNHVRAWAVRASGEVVFGDGL